MPTSKPLEELLAKLSKENGELTTEAKTYFINVDKIKNEFLREYVRILRKYYYYNDADVVNALLDIDKLVEEEVLNDKTISELQS